MSEVLEAPARPALANFIGGEWRPSRSGRTYEKRGPWRPSEIVGEFPASGEEDVNAAVAAAAAAFPEWAATPAAKRGAILNKAADVIESHAEQIAQDMTLEMGKPIRESRLEAMRACAGPPLLLRRGLRPERRALRADAAPAASPTPSTGRSASSG